MGIASLVLNALIMVLLAVTIAYCWLLNRRIRVLQDSKSELAQLLKHFDQSTTRASESIVALQSASKKIGDTIQSRIDKANFLMDDLSFLIEKGNKTINQMEAGMAVSRARNRVMAEQPPARPEPQEMTAIRQAVQESLQAPPAKASMPPPPAPTPVPQASSRERTAASLEAVLERIAERSNKPAPEKERTQRGQPAGARSRAEQELIDMLRSGIKG